MLGEPGAWPRIEQAILVGYVTTCGKIAAAAGSLARAHEGRTAADRMQLRLSRPTILRPRGRAPARTFPERTHSKHRLCRCAFAPAVDRATAEW